jgi:hypothetical protein
VALLLRSLARQELARSFYRDIVNENDFFYIFVGKTTEWSNEPIEEEPLDTEFYNGTTHRNMMFVKRVQPTDVVLMARRIDWEQDTVYDQYEDDIDLSQSNFYVLTSDMRVYKCLNNNNGSPSQYKPSNEDVNNAFLLPDGYVWKYMFSVEASDEIKFLTVDYIPVRKMAGVGQPLYDINGELDQITIVNPGSGYDIGNVPQVIVHGDGNGATVTIDGVNEAGEITSVSFTGGSGYSFAYLTLVDNGTGSGAEFSVELGNNPTSVIQENIEAAAIPGTVDRIVLTAVGENYSIDDVLVQIVGDGTGAEAVAEVNAFGEISNVRITNQGTGYTFAEVYFNNILGLGTGAVAKATVSPYYGHGSNPIKELYATNVCVSVNLDNDTSDYFLNNDFRQVGIVKNVLKSNDANFTDDTGTTCYIIEVDDVSLYNVDDEIWTNTGGRFVVAQIVSELNKIYLLPIIPSISSTSILSNNTQTISDLTINSLTAPDVINTTGEILYIENRRQITRQQDQVEKVRTIINF